MTPFGYHLFIYRKKVPMQEYRKVTILGPVEIATKEEPIKEENNKSHEDMLYEMLNKRLWQDYDSNKINNEFSASTTFHEIPVNLRAAYVAYKIGLTTIYKTEHEIIVFVSTCVTENQITFIINNYAHEENRNLSFQTYIKTEEGFKYYENSNMYLNNDTYQTVFNDLITTLNMQKESWQKEMGRFNYAR